jgi:hypothetical protein
VIYAYGICEPVTAACVSGHRGLGGAALHAVDRGRLAGVYTRHRSTCTGPLSRLVLEHERVVEAIMAAGPVLPLRAGTGLACPEDLARVLDERHDEFLRSLDHVRGRTELGIRVTPHHQFPGRRADGSSGREYLMARVQEQRRSRQAIREVHAELAILARAARVRPPRPPAVLTASYLVDADRTGDFRRRAEQLARRQTELEIMVTGPWPPYSFATEAQA